MTPASPKPHGAAGHGLWTPRQGAGGCLTERMECTPHSPKLQGCSACPRLPYARRQTHKPLAHSLLHTRTPHQGSPPTAALAATPPRGMPGGSTGSLDSHLPPKPHSKAAGVNWLVSTNTLPRHLHLLLGRSLGRDYFFSFFFFLNQKNPPKIIIFLIVSPNINGGTCSSDNTLKEQYRTHCLQRGNVQARGTRTRGGSGDNSTQDLH